MGLRFFARSSLKPGEEVAVLGVAVAAGGGLIRGGTERRGISRGIGVRAVSLVSGATVGVGNIRGGKEGRFTGVKIGDAFADGSVETEGVVVSPGVFRTGGAVLRGIIDGVVTGADAFGIGVGLIRTGSDGEGRVLGVMEIAGVGVAEAAGMVVAASVAEDTGDALGLGRLLGDGRVRGEIEALGDAEVGAVEAAVGLAL